MSEHVKKRFNRFPPRGTIEWLDREQRKEHRKTIKLLTDLSVLMERGVNIPQEQETIIRALTRSEARDTQMNALWQMLEQTEMAYYAKLAAMAPHDLTAYHELMNPHEPPASHHYFLCDHLMKLEAGEIMTLIVALPPGAAKALALDTPIPTPNGWKAMGDLRVGDKVYDENGKPCSVTWVSPVWKDRPVYRVTTDCGDTIVADRDHEWLVCPNRENGKFEIKETHELEPKWGKRPLVRRARALECVEKNLPIEPYLLGLWLGDGTSASVSITSSDEDRPWFREELGRLGYTTTDRADRFLFGVTGVRDRFVSLGLLNDPAHNTHGRKHIPIDYLRASYEQRLSLLQGLIDSDGTVCKRRGSATFCNTNKELASQVRELVRSLGVKAGWSVGRSVLNGVDYGEVYRVSFYHERAARLPRKALLCRNQRRTPDTYLEIEPAGIADTVCIEVSSPSHLFLCGESMTPTHNSTYTSRSFAQWVMGRNPDWRVLACGHALALDTEVPTPDGFTTIEKLKIGDQVFAPDGKPVRVLGKSTIFQGHKCYLAEFSNGAIATVDADHLWKVKSRKAPVKTKDLFALVENERGFSLPEVFAVEYQKADLPIDPYVLGLWLGDGDSSSSKIASGVEDREELMALVAECGYTPKALASKHHFSIKELPAQLRASNLIHNKHIPAEYLTASVEQRWALVQGLMDSDGYSTDHGDLCEFSNTNEKLIDGLHELLSSLGIKARKWFSKAGKNSVLDGWRVHFKSSKAFKLSRKAATARDGCKSVTVRFYETDSVPTQCILVDHPEHLFLITRGYIPTHNTQKFTEDEFSKPTRGAIDSDLYRMAFPDVSLNPNEKGASFWRLDGWRGSYACRGALAGTSGLRAKIVVADDLFKNAADAMSAVVRDNIWRWWTADVMSRRLPNAPTVLVNTLWHTDDVPNRLKKLHEDNPKAVPHPFVFINIPAQAEEDDPIGRTPGEWLWCKEQQEDGFYTINDYETKRATMPPSLWSALYLGKPLDKMGDFIAEDQFQTYENLPINRKNYTIEWTKTVLTIDCAQKGKERSDYTALLVFRVGVDGIHYLVDAWRGKEPLEKVVRILGKLMRVWSVNYAIVEDAGFGSQIIENYQGKLPAPLVTYTPSGKGAKDFRFDAACPWITSGKILFPKNAPWKADLINEFVAFPNGTNDDWVDSFSQYTDHELKTRTGGTKPLKTRG